MSASPYRASPQQDTRKRQTRRDEAIRKRIEGELSRKAGKPSTPTQNKRRGGNAASGTVSALRPLPALTVPQSMSITDASQLCAAKRTDCVLVVDDDEHLAGIFTAKDLAYRIVAENLDPRATSVSEIMTTSPMVTRDTTNATDALNTMVTRGFRHLPVCNEDGDVIGLLDIAKVFYEALEKLERAHGTSQKLYNALEGVQNEWGGSAMGPQQAMMQYVESLREHMSMPDLNSILDSRTLPCTVGVRTSVRDAAKVMKQYHTTAVCVMENGPSGNAASGQGIAKGKIAGIFTSKDIVLRVIAAGLDPKTCSVIRVMTPHPETSSPSLNIQEALRKMHGTLQTQLTTDGHFLNLPVVDVDARLVGVVDVLKLTYATLEQVNSMGDEQGSGAGGPMWNRFWNSFGQSGSVDESSAVSGSQQPYSPHTADLTSDVHPNDSASAVGASTHDGASNAGVPEMDDGTYLFKFVTPSGRVHRFQARYDNFETIHEIVMIKLANDPFFLDTSAGGFAASSSTMRTDFDQDHGLPAPIFTPPMPSGPSVNPPSLDDFHLAYKDDEDDLVLITTDGDVLDSVAVAKHQGKDRVLLILQGGRTWDEAASRDGSYSGFASSSSVSAANLRKRKAEAGGNAEAQGRRGKSDHIFGFFPKDLALPAAIGFLGIAVLGAVTLTRANAR